MYKMNKMWESGKINIIIYGKVCMAGYEYFTAYYITGMLFENCAHFPI